MVLTVSAGNSSLPYVQNPASFANATDANGKLVLNGQMLVVGNWNDQAGRIEGAMSGSVCKTVTNNVCQDKYRVSDFYILAPGMAVKSTVPTTSNVTSYQSMSGTSQAAPVVAGAVALVNQMWPYMTAENQVQLLLKTANKNIPGYNVATHGQGLLDLNRATQPVGSLGISLTGRTGTAVPIQGGITLSAMVGQAKTTLSSISAVDSLQRDFTVNLSGGVNTNTLMAHPMLMDADPGFNWSGRWTGLVAGQNQALPMSGLQNSTDSTITIDSRVFAPKSKTLHQVTVTNSAYNPYVNFSGAWGNSGGATTVEYSALDRSPSGWWTQWGVMSTQVKYSSGLVNEVTPILAVHGMVGYQAGDWNFFGGVKPTVMYGEVKMNVPTSVDADGNMNYNQARTNLANFAPVGYVGVKWQHNFARGQSLTARASVAQDGTNNVKVYYNHAL
jgi:hypothetical protein